jgi:hypothetical protein
VPFYRSVSAVVKPKQPGPLHKSLGLIMKSDGKPGDGMVLVRVKDMDDSADAGTEILAGFICRVSLFPVPIKGRTLEELENREGIRVYARRLTTQQRWCIF